MAMACAAQFLSEYFLCLSLGCDETTLCHKSILAVNAISENCEGKHLTCLLGLVQLPEKVIKVQQAMMGKTWPAR